MSQHSILVVLGVLAAIGLVPLLVRDHRLGIRRPPAFEFPSARTTAPPATVVAYEDACRQLNDQLKSLTDVDTKLGVVIGALGALMAAFIAATPPVIEKAIIGSWLVIALREAYRGFRFDHYRYAPGYRGALSQAQSSPNLVKWYGFLAMAEAIEVNRLRLTTKGFFLNRAVLTIAVIVAIAVIARMFGLS